MCVSIEELKYDSNNFNKHTDSGMKLLEKSISENGLGRSILVDKQNNIIAGNATVETARNMGKSKIKVVETDGTELVVVKRTDIDIDSTIGRNLALADNAVSDGNLNWDFDALRKAADDFSINPAEWGIELPDVDKMLNDSDDEAMVDESEVQTRCASGDIWKLGNHLLYCQDSTKPENISKVIGGGMVDVVFTDPPYNMSDNMTGFLTDENRKQLEKITDFDCKILSDIVPLIRTHQWYIFTSKDLIKDYFKIFEKMNFNILFWAKSNPTPMTNNTFLPDTEYLLYFYEKGRIWNNGLDLSVYHKYYVSDKLKGRKEAGNVHPTIKPLEIIMDKLQICSQRNGIVVDLFGGSGSTLIACEKLKRNCVMFEMSPEYCDIIIARWEKLTGLTAEKIK